MAKIADSGSPDRSSEIHWNISTFHFSERIHFVQTRREEGKVLDWRRLTDLTLNQYRPACIESKASAKSDERAQLPAARSSNKSSTGYATPRHQSPVRFITNVGAFIADRMRQLIDIQPCLNKHANMTLVAVPGAESRSVTGHDWKILLRNSANNMLTRPPYDVPRANFADNQVGFRCSTICARRSRA